MDLTCLRNVNSILSTFGLQSQEFTEAQAVFLRILGCGTHMDASKPSHTKETPSEDLNGSASQTKDSASEGGVQSLDETNGEIRSKRVNVMPTPVHEKAVSVPNSHYDTINHCGPFKWLLGAKDGPRTTEFTVGLAQQTMSDLQFACAEGIKNCCCDVVTSHRNPSQQFAGLISTTFPYSELSVDDQEGVALKSNLSSMDTSTNTERPEASKIIKKSGHRETTSLLKNWLYDHRRNPYPTKGEKIMLAMATQMNLTQVSTWFANARRRLKKENKITWSSRNRTSFVDSPPILDVDEPMKETVNRPERRPFPPVGCYLEGAPPATTSDSCSRELIGPFSRPPHLDSSLHWLPNPADFDPLSSYLTYHKLVSNLVPAQPPRNSAEACTTNAVVNSHTASPPTGGCSLDQNCRHQLSVAESLYKNLCQYILLRTGQSQQESRVNQEVLEGLLAGMQAVLSNGPSAEQCSCKLRVEDKDPSHSHLEPGQTVLCDQVTRDGRDNKIWSLAEIAQDVAGPNPGKLANKSMYNPFYDKY